MSPPRWSSPKVHVLPTSTRRGDTLLRTERRLWLKDVRRNLYEKPNSFNIDKLLFFWFLVTTVKIRTTLKKLIQVRGRFNLIWPSFVTHGVTHNKKGPNGKPLSPCFKWSWREDLNLRPPAPKACVQFINPYFNYTYGDARCVLCHWMPGSAYQVGTNLAQCFFVVLDPHPQVWVPYV